MPTFKFSPLTFMVFTAALTAAGLAWLGIERGQTTQATTVAPVALPGIPPNERDINETTVFAANNPLLPIKLQFDCGSARSPFVIPPAFSSKRIKHERPYFFLAGSVKLPLANDYRYLTLLDPNGDAVAAMRWCNGDEDTLIKFTKTPGHAIIRRIDNDSIEQDSTATQVAIGENTLDMLGAFRELRKIAAAGRKEAVICTLKKSTTSIYAGRLTFVGEESLPSPTMQTARKWMQCRKYATTVSYAIPIWFDQTTTIQSLQHEYLPEMSSDEVLKLVKLVTTTENLKELNGHVFALPVSIETYNRIMNRNREFEGPFGLHREIFVWCEKKSGKPIKIQGEMRGVGIELQPVAGRTTNQ